LIVLVSMDMPVNDTPLPPLTSLPFTALDISPAVIFSI
jgi:hypothetical protein